MATNLFVEFKKRFETAYSGTEFNLFPSCEKVKGLWAQTQALFPFKNHVYIHDITGIVSTLPPYPQKFNNWSDLVINLDRDLRYLYQTNQHDQKKILDLMFETTLLSIRMVNDLLRNGETGKRDAIMLTCSLSSTVSRFQCDSLLKSAQIADPREEIRRLTQNGNLQEALNLAQNLSEPFIYSKDALLLNIFKVYLNRGEYAQASRLFEKIEAPLEILTGSFMWLEESKKNPAASIYLTQKIFAHISTKTS